MNRGLSVCVVTGLALAVAGCGEKRVHVLPEIEQINRVAVVNLAAHGGKGPAEAEFFTNEFVSVGFSVVERGHLQDVIKEAFTATGYLDERSVAQWGRGLGIEGVVLHQIVGSAPVKDDGAFDMTGWVRVVHVETGKIVLTYNIDMRASAGGNASRAAKMYAERVVDDIREALKQKKIRPGTAIRIEVKPANVEPSTQANP